MCWQLASPQHLFLSFFLLPHTHRLIFNSINSYFLPHHPPSSLSSQWSSFRPTHGRGSILKTWSQVNLTERVDVSVKSYFNLSPTHVLNENCTQHKTLHSLLSGLLTWKHKLLTIQGSPNPVKNSLSITYSLVLPRGSLGLMTSQGRAWKPARGYKARKGVCKELTAENYGQSLVTLTDEAWEDSFQPLELLRVRKGTRLDHFSGLMGERVKSFKVGLGCVFQLGWSHILPNFDHI